MKTNKALLVMIALLSATLVEASKDKKCCKRPEGVLKESFAKGGPTPGTAINSISDFTDFATDAVIQKKNGCFHRLLVKATGVHKENWADPVHQGNVDGWRNELASAIVALKCDGSVDTSFGDNGVAWDDSFGDYSDYLWNIDLAPQDKILVAGTTSRTQEGAPSWFNFDTICNFNGAGNVSGDYSCDYKPFYEENGDLSYSVRNLACAMYDGDGVPVAAFGNGGYVNFETPLPVTQGTFGNMAGQSSQAAQVSHNKERYYIVGAQAENNQFTECFDYNSLVVAVDLKTLPGTLDTTFGGTGFVTNAFGLNFSYFQALIEQHDGKIIAVGHGVEEVLDHSAASLADRTPRIVIARFNPNGTLDASFGGNNGRVVITANNGTDQLLARAIALDCHGNIFIGGDIAPSFSGYPLPIFYGPTPGTNQTPAQGRDFLLIKLDKDGKPPVVAFGDELLDHYNFAATTPLTGVRTDFQGFSDAIFALSINDKCSTITAVGQASTGADISQMKVGAARYSTKDGDLDKSFGTGGKVIVDSGTNGQSFAHALVELGKNNLLFVGQATTGATNFVWGQEDTTQTDTLVGQLK